MGGGSLFFFLGGGGGGGINGIKISQIDLFTLNYRLLQIAIHYKLSYC